MVVFFPRPSHTSRRRSDYYSSDSDDDDEAAGGGARYYYVRVEAVSSSDSDDDDDHRQSSTARGRRRRRRGRRNNRRARLILEAPDDYDYDDTDEEEEEEESDDDWDPCLHLLDLPLRPMGRFQKAFIDVFFAVVTVAMEGYLVWTALQQDGADRVINWLLAAPLMLPVMGFILVLARVLYLLATSDFSWRPAPAPAPPADENV